MSWFHQWAGWMGQGKWGGRQVEQTGRADSQMNQVTVSDAEYVGLDLIER
jgi:hypothetical protein